MRRALDQHGDFIRDIALSVGCGRACVRPVVGWRIPSWCRPRGALEGVLARATRRGARVLEMPSDVPDRNGLRTARIASPLCDVVHTLVEAADDGPAAHGSDSALGCACALLGQGQPVVSSHVRAGLLRTVDHIAVCVPHGSLADVEQWYVDVLGVCGRFRRRRARERHPLVRARICRLFTRVLTGRSIRYGPVGYSLC